MTQQAIYAIGDVHGEADRLRALHASILEDHRLQFPDCRLKLIHLGDYVDRGPDSAGVIETLIEMEQRTDLDCISLRGNHEQMMLDAYDQSGRAQMQHWLSNGGEATLESYRRRGMDVPSPAHLDWIRNLPTLHLEDARQMAFVHAGVDPETFPDCSEQIRLWTRSNRFFDPGRWDRGALDGWQVIHGHTPTKDFEPQMAGAPPRRYNLDTGAVYGGRLTAGVFAPGAGVRFLSS